MSYRVGTLLWPPLYEQRSDELPKDTTPGELTKGAFIFIEDECLTSSGSKPLSKAAVTGNQSFYLTICQPFDKVKLYLCP